jgi:hypothetical protein
VKVRRYYSHYFNPLNAELNPVRHLLALAGAHHFVDVSRIRVKVDRLNSSVSIVTKLQGDIILFGG